MRIRGVVGRIYGMRYRWKGHKRETQEQSKRSGQARLVYVRDTNLNIPTTRRWARGDWEAEGSISHVTKQPFLCSSLVESESIAMLPEPRSGELRTQKIKSHLMRTQSLNVLPLKPGVGQYIAIHATLISSLLISTLPIHSPAFFSKNLSRVLKCDKEMFVWGVSKELFKILCGTFYNLFNDYPAVGSCGRRN